MAQSIQPIPKWVMQRYAKLWEKFKDREVSYEGIQETLKGDSRNIISVFLNELKNAGWIEIRLHEVDMRKRVYALKQPELIVRGIAK